MQGKNTLQKPALKLIEGALQAPETWVWFCGRCAAPAPREDPPPPTARVCESCGMGVLLEAREDTAPAPSDAFLVVDSALRVQAMSAAAELLLGVDEKTAVNSPVVELMVPADAEGSTPAGFAAAIVEAASGADEPVKVFLRPGNTFGVRLRARIAPCGPPRAALVVLEPARPGLHAVSG
jgi:hypothetical protein